MQLITVQQPDNFNHFFFGDAHECNPLSSNGGWEQLVDMLHSPYDGCKNNTCSDGGDMIDAITVDDKRFDPRYATDKQGKPLPLPLRQAKMAVERRRPIAKLLQWILDGNHEYALRRFGDITQSVCEELGVTYGTYSVKATFLDKKGNLMFKAYDTHGRKGISSAADDPLRRETNMRLTLKRHLKFKAGDCAVMVKHHTHKLLVCKPESELYLTDHEGAITQNYTGWGQAESYIHPDLRWYGNAGSFLKLFGDGISGYAELAEYDPVELGFLVLKVRDRKIVSLDKVRLDI